MASETRWQPITSRQSRAIATKWRSSSRPIGCATRLSLRTRSRREGAGAIRRGYENDPSFLLGESLQAVAFDRHPYGQGVIGSKSEIQHMTRDGLYAHYRTHYAPNNA